MRIEVFVQLLEQKKRALKPETRAVFKAYSKEIPIGDEARAENEPELNVELSARAQDSQFTGRLNILQKNRDSLQLGQINKAPPSLSRQDRFSAKTIEDSLLQIEQSPESLVDAQSQLDRSRAENILLNP